MSELDPLFKFIATTAKYVYHLHSWSFHRQHLLFVIDSGFHYGICDGSRCHSVNLTAALSPPQAFVTKLSDKMQTPIDHLLVQQRLPGLTSTKKTQKQTQNKQNTPDILRLQTALAPTVADLVMMGMNC